MTSDLALQQWPLTSPFTVTAHYARQHCARPERRCVCGGAACSASQRRGPGSRVALVALQLNASTASAATTARATADSESARPCMRAGGAALVTLARRWQRHSEQQVRHQALKREDHRPV
jgi:hypothetical protein